MRTLILFLLLTTTAFATPCDDARKDYRQAKKFGAYNFRCVDRYDGTATSSWMMSDESYKRWTERRKGR